MIDDVCRWRSGQALRPYFEDVMLIIKNKHYFADLHDIVDDTNIRYDSFKFHLLMSELIHCHYSFVHCPIIDCGIIDDARVLHLAYMVVKSLLQGDVIYMHCWGGHGRTGTVVCLVLHLLYGLDVASCLERCQLVHDLR